MYEIETQASFDSAHFLRDYQGKCGNIHGHRWTIKVMVQEDRVETENPQTRGMLMDFKDLKQVLKGLCKQLDHSLIIETGSMQEDTLALLIRDGFRIVELPFRPTAENLAKYVYDQMREQGCPVSKAMVYETPNNCAVYYEA